MGSDAMLKLLRSYGYNLFSFGRSILRLKADPAEVGEICTGP
jgi:hypothetical protein